MLLKPNKPVDLTVQVNDTFYREATNEFYDKTNMYDLLRMEASLNFNRTTDFRTFAEAVKFDKQIHIRYNYQVGYSRMMHKRVKPFLN